MGLSLRWGAWASLTLAIGLIVAACGGGNGSAGPPELLVVSSRDGDYAIYGMRSDGSDQHRLSDEKGDPSTPAGLQFQVEPAWSPDATKIAFASSRDGTSHIYVMSPDGSGAQRLTKSADNDQLPAWSPDGATIAFVRSTDQGRLFVMDADGGDQHRLTDDDAPESDPAWSPDGSTIAYSRRTPGSNVREIWLADADGGNRRPLTKLGSAAIEPAWAPDGSLVAFAASPGGARYGIFTIGVDGEDIKRVAAAPDDAIEPAFSPDGAKLAYSSGGAIVVLDAAGDDSELTDPDDNDSSPAWNPTLRPGEVAG